MYLLHLSGAWQSWIKTFSDSYSSVNIRMHELPSLLIGIAVAGVAYVLIDIMLRPRVVSRSLGRFEVDRREKMRAASATYRLFEPWVDELAAPILRANNGLDLVQQHLLSAGIAVPWTPAEFLATKRIEAFGAAGIGFGLGWAWGGLTSALIGCAAGFYIYEVLAKRLLKSVAIRRQIKLKRRFAATVDLMALMMEVGAGFQESLTVAAEESKGNPLGDELAIVRRDLTMGKREDALRNFSRRTQDDDIEEVVMSVIEGEALGTPLAKIFRVQAEQMRQKRTQWAEKSSAEAEVALVFPAMLIMVACLILVAAPFVLTAIFNPEG